MADYISRQAAIRIVCDDECEDCPSGGCDMYRRLKRLPAADVRPVVSEPECREKICLRALDHFGVEHQKRKLLEELAELMTEIAREQDGRTEPERVREELADVIIMCEQMRIVFGQAAVDGWIRRKLERLVERMNEEGPDGK